MAGWGLEVVDVLVDGVWFGLDHSGMLSDIWSAQTVGLETVILEVLAGCLLLTEITLQRSAKVCCRLRSGICWAELTFQTLVWTLSLLLLLVAGAYRDQTVGLRRLADRLDSWGRICLLKFPDWAGLSDVELLILIFTVNLSRLNVILPVGGL